MDESGKATLQEAQSASFKPYQNFLNIGYTHKIAWLKLRISGTPETSPLVLIVRPSFLRKVELYDAMQNAGNSGPPLISGRATRLLQDSYQSPDLGFKIPASEHARDVYLRIDTPTILIADCRVLPIEDAMRESRFIIALLFSYIGFLVLTLIWGLINWAIQQNPIYGYFAFRQLYLVFHTLFFTGLFRYWLSGTLNIETEDFLYCFVVVTLPIALALFDLKLLKDFGVSNRLWKIIRTVTLLPIVSLLLLLSGYTMEALHLNIIIDAVLAVLLIALAFTVNTDKTKPLGSLLQWLLKAGYLTLYAMVLLPVLIFSSVKIGFFPHQLQIILAAISSMLMIILLAINSRQRDHVLNDSLIQQRIAKEQTSQEMNLRIEKEMFLAMLTHELRHPLTVIRLLTSEESDNHHKLVQKATNDMSQIIDRIEQSEKLDKHQLLIESSHFDAASLLREVRLMQAVPDRIEIDLKDPIQLHSDRNLLLNMLNNLLSNAIKYGKTDSLIHLRGSLDTRKGRMGALFAVINEPGSAGMPDAEKVFSKYYRSAKVRQPGSGLGLYLVSHWAKAIGGTAEFHAINSGESRQMISFSIWIPI